MICDPCKEPHDAAQCIDTQAGREYPDRHCACQHKPRRIDIVFTANDSFGAGEDQEREPN